MLKAVVFDMDGTLLDSEFVHYVVIHEIIRKQLGYDQSVEEYMKYCGTPDSQMWPAILQELHLWENRAEEKQAASEELERLHWEQYESYVVEHGVSVFPGVKDLFASLKEEGFRIAVATGSLRKIVDRNLEMMGITEYVDAVAASEDCTEGKPSPEIFLKAAEFLGVEPACCFVVEDSRNGLLAAERAGMGRAGFDGSRLPAQVELAPVVISDYRMVSPADFVRWHQEQQAEGA